MRPIMEMETAEETARKVIHLSPSRAPTPCDPHIHNCRWWPYSSSNEFGANTAVIIIILLCALICALVLNTAIRCFLRSSNSSRRRHPPDRLPQTQRDGQLQKPNCMAGAAPLVMATTLVYSAGMKLGGAEAEAEDAADCAICLSEFEEGEGIRVLGSCKHGFHIHCIEQWLFSHSSCPICRRSCLASSPSSQQNVDCCSGNGENESSQQHVEPE